MLKVSGLGKHPQRAGAISQVRYKMAPRGYCHRQSKKSSVTTDYPVAVDLPSAAYEKLTLYRLSPGSGLQADGGRHGWSTA